MNFRIRELCKEKKVLFKDLARDLGITDVGLRQSLQGNPTIGTLERVAAALNVPVVELFAPNFGDFTAMIDFEGKMYRCNSIDETRCLLDRLMAELRK